MLNEVLPALAWIIREEALFPVAAKDLKELKENIGEVEETLFQSEFWTNIGYTSLRIFLIIAVAGLVVRIGKILIRRFFSIKLKGPIRKTERREQTLIKLLENALAYVVYFAAILAILEEFTIDVKGLLAGAGVLGLAVGFGAQSLVKDVISGFFIIFEDQFAVGDYVRIGSAEGTVEEIGLRTTKIGLYGGEVYIIPNGQIAEVTNFSVNNSKAILDLGLAYETDIDHAVQIIQQFLESLPSDRYEKVIGVPTVVGVQSIAQNEIVLRIVAETEPVANFEVARKLRQDLKKLLETHGFKIPYPKMTVFQENKEGDLNG